MATSLPPTACGNARPTDQKPAGWRRHPAPAGSGPAFAAKSVDFCDAADMIGFITGS
jgi:hypothetical protein